MTSDEMAQIPRQALDVQLDLLRYYTRTEVGRRYAESIISEALRIGDNQPVQGIGIKMHELVLIGETYAVAEDIIDVLEFAAETIPTFMIERSDLPSQSGFVYLERPIILPDIRSQPLVVHAIGWHVAKMHDDDEEREALAEIAGESPAMALALEGALSDEKFPREALAVVLFTDPRDPRDHMNETWERELAGRTGAPLLSMIGGVWEIGRSDWPEWTTPAKALNLGKFVLAFLRFIQEPWVEYRQMVPSRHLEKRAKRGKIEEPSIHIVQLRRATHHVKAGGVKGEAQEWSHRWLVRGHWRNQWYPSARVHRPRWIPEHIKGPDDKPLIVHDKIFSVDR